MKKIIFPIALIAFITLIAFTSCKKGPGTGGRATIKGKVWTRKHDSKYNVVDSYASADEPVYIIYGEETNYGDKVNTNYNGEYEFQYLRKGNYKIYVYSDDSVKKSTATEPLLVPKMAIVQDITIKDRKETIDAGKIVVLH